MLHIFNSELIQGGKPPNQYFGEMRMHNAVLGRTVKAIKTNFNFAKTHERARIKSESSDPFTATDPQLYIQNYFKLFSYVVYAAGTKFKRTFFARCALYDAVTDSVDYILMRVLSTCCDSPNRAWYVYQIKLGAFKIYGGKII